MNKITANRFPDSVLLARRGMVVAIILGMAASAFAQTRLKLSAIKPGTERVQLMNNGDFQFQGPLVGDSFPFPSGWPLPVPLPPIPVQISGLQEIGFSSNDNQLSYCAKRALHGSQTPWESSFRLNCLSNAKAACSRSSPLSGGN